MKSQTDQRDQLDKAQAALCKLASLADLIAVAGNTEQADTINWIGVGDLLRDVHDDLKPVIDPGVTQQRAEARQGGEHAVRGQD